MPYENTAIYSEQIGQYPLLKIEEERDLLIRAYNGEEVAKHKIILGNLRLVFVVAKEICGNRGNPNYFDDVIAEGNIGLIEAVNKFNPIHNVKFCTYARFWIRQRMLLYINQKMNLIRLPRSLNQRIRKMSKARDSYAEIFGREPDDEELAEIMDITSRNVQVAKQGELMSGENSPSSIPFQEDYVFEDKDAADIFKNHDLREKLLVVLDELSGIDARIIYLRFFEEYSSYEIADKLKVTVYFVKKSEKMAIKRLRELLAA